MSHLILTVSMRGLSLFFFFLSQASNSPIHSTSFCGAFSLSGFPLLNTYCDLASPSSLHFPCVSAQPRQGHGGGRGRRGSAGGAPADRGQRLLQEGPPRGRHRLLHRGKLSSPRVHFSCPLDSTQNKYIFFPRLWLWHQIKNVSFAMKPLIGNRALPRRRRLLDESGPMPFQAQVSSNSHLPPPLFSPLGPVCALAWKMKNLRHSAQGVGQGRRG